MKTIMTIFFFALSLNSFAQVTKKVSQADRAQTITCEDQTGYKVTIVLDGPYSKAYSNQTQDITADLGSSEFGENLNKILFEAHKVKVSEISCSKVIEEAKLLRSRTHFQNLSMKINNTISFIENKMDFHEDSKPFIDTLEREFELKADIYWELGKLNEQIAHSSIKE